MSGGLFKDKPFSLNVKCVLFSFYSALLYAAGGGKNPLLIALIFVVSYVLLAWYDYAYDCDTFMFSGTGPGPSGLFKPQDRCKDRDVNNPDPDDLVADQEKAYLNKVYFFHALIIAPLLIYAGFTGQKTHPHILSGIGGMGSLAFVYHAMRIKYPREVWR